MALRFGDCTTSIGFKQTEVAYCDTHAELVKRLFVTCDERPVLAVEDGVERAAQPWS